MALREEEEEKKTSQIFDEGMKIFEDVSKSSEATNSSAVQVSTIRYVRSTLLKIFRTYITCIQNKRLQK
jgi:hypothetical protein